jgi:hypothetical protein
MSIFLGATKSEKVLPSFVFNVYDYEKYDENIIKFVKRETIKRANRYSAENFIKNKYSYKVTGHRYYVELVGSYNTAQGKKEFLKRNPK